MLFQIQNFKKLLLSINKYKVESIYIKSQNLNLTINTVKHKNQILLNTQTTHDPIKTKEIHSKNRSINPKEVNQKTKNLTEQNTYFTIVSPMIGTFYRSPAPNESPFIEINDTVKINQTVCIIEAMKLMNEIESEVNGHIVEILVQDGDIVDCGQALMRVQQKQH